MILFRTFTLTDQELLVSYLNSLSPETRSRFGPHGYNTGSIQTFYSDERNIGILGFSGEKLVVYAILRIGYLDHDLPRLEGYGLALNNETDATYAPSISDAWQGKGIGYELFSFVEKLAKSRGVKRIILWGGVQSANERAVKHYQRIGFRSLGGFEYNGWNLDMVL